MSADTATPQASRQPKTRRLVFSVGEGRGLAWEREEARRERVADFWAEKGFDVAARIETIEFRGARIFCLRSNLVGGLPRQRAFSNYKI